MLQQLAQTISLPRCKISLIVQPLLHPTLPNWISAAELPNPVAACYGELGSSKNEELGCRGWCGSQRKKKVPLNRSMSTPSKPFPPFAPPRMHTLFPLPLQFLIKTCRRPPRCVAKLGQAFAKFRVRVRRFMDMEDGCWFREGERPFCLPFFLTCLHADSF